METLADLFSIHWHWVVWASLGVVGGLGLLATVSPRLFSLLAACGGIWVDTGKLAHKLDRQVLLDQHVLRHSRLLGMFLVGATAAFAVSVMPPHVVGRWAVWTLSGVFGGIGLLAILSPRLFALLAACGGKWVDTDKLLSILDQRVEIDHYVLRHSRLFGMLILAAVVAVTGLLL